MLQFHTITQLGSGRWMYSKTTTHQDRRSSYQASLVPSSRPAFRRLTYCKWWKAGWGLGTMLPGYTDMQRNGVKGEVPCIPECFIQSFLNSLQLCRVLLEKSPVTLKLLLASKLWKVKWDKRSASHSFCSTVETSGRYLYNRAFH